MSVLSRLVTDGPSTASALAAAERIRPQSVAAILGALDGRGLIQREPDPHDGRRHLVCRRARPVRRCSTTRGGPASNGWPGRDRLIPTAAGAVRRPAGHRDAPAGDRHRWTALANTTAAVFMAQLDGSIVLIAMPVVFALGAALAALAAPLRGRRPGSGGR